MATTFIRIPNIDAALSAGYSLIYQDGAVGSNSHVLRGWKLVGDTDGLNMPMAEQWQAWYWLPRSFWTIKIEFDDETPLLEWPHWTEELEKLWESILLQPA